MVALIASQGSSTIRKHGRALVAALSIVGIGSAAGAASCDRTTIRARTVEDTAKAILEESNYVGLGVVRNAVTAAHIEQQEVEILMPIKGPASVVKLSPYRVNRVRKVDGLIRWFHSKPDEVRLFALSTSDDGVATHVCLAATLASKPTADLVRALVREAR
jgi:hypothetical protein